MLKRTLLLIVLSLGLLTLSGCFSAPKLGKVTVQIESINPDPSGAVVTLRFSNPNNIPLGIVSTKHSLYLGGNYMGIVTGETPIGIPSLGTVSQSISLPAPVAEAVMQFAATHQGITPYVLQSTLHLNWHDDVIDWKASDQGFITLAHTTGTAR